MYICAIAAASLSTACAGRAPAAVAVVQPTDNALTCSAMLASVSSNNDQITELGNQKGAKVAQNVAAGIVGLVVWPVWFLMDFQGAAGTEIKALQDRNAYLATKVNADGCDANPPVTARAAAPAYAPRSVAPAYVPPGADTYAIDPYEIDAFPTAAGARALRPAQRLPTSIEPL